MTGLDAGEGQMEHRETVEKEAGRSADGLSAEERRQRIADWVAECGEVRIDQLRHFFGVSEVTLRRDLDILESQNRIRRVRGGATANPASALETRFQEKMGLNTAEKRQIAAAAAAMVEDGQVVMLSAGSTTTYLARELLKKRHLTVITPAINIAAELAGHPHITLVMIGGIVRPGSYAAVGHLADEALTQMNADFAFVGVDGVDVQAGFTTPNLMESRTDKMMLHSATRGVIVADRSKFGRVTLAPVARIDEPDLWITDDGMPEETLARLREAGCRVVRAREAAAQR
ncbi:DeoR/GlpR family DNA-binding transcription regulator [Alicyclobacillus macrosporangiidus]|uniref:DeoR/GlpR family DNA-binding transcription regulator n=1 Tax=Alicyclobacillus macrosporangiidus TaxID=392015 RepID=UPI0026EF8A03|nr:DeoR/GlpR family DNA-binding transcription regulator [Alicyclobacillus macrosporangiidus]